MGASQRRELNNRMQAQCSLRLAELPINHDPDRGRTLLSLCGEGLGER
jgi:hypothetical protein